MSNTNIKKVRTSDLELKDRLVSIQRVTKVTKGGRTFSFSAIVVVGNEDGVVGYGLGKASEVQSAIAKGVWGYFDEGCVKRLQVNMANIRRKIEKTPAQPKYIFTEVGVGYRMAEGDEP